MCPLAPLLCREGEEEGCPDSPPHSIEKLGFPRDCKLHGEGFLICLLLLLFNSTPFCFRLACLLSLSLLSSLSLFSFSSLFLFTPHSHLRSSFFTLLSSGLTSPLHFSPFTPSGIFHSFFTPPHQRTHSSLNLPSFSFVWLNTHTLAPQHTDTFSPQQQTSPPPHPYRSLSISSLPPYTPYF